MNITELLTEGASPIVMGIINCTPDSFYADSRAQYQQDVLAIAQAHLDAGAAILDLGAASSRPHSQPVSIEEEINRLSGPLQWIKEAYPKAYISVDTYHAAVAEYALSNGAKMINDISGGSFDPQILDVVSQSSCPYVAMHIQGNQQTMHHQYSYQNITSSVYDYFQQKLDLYSQKDINDVIIDPGFGFSKTGDDNFQLLAELMKLKALNRPILIGLSRKRMVWQTLQLDAERALNGTTVLNTIALLKGANILRVHDVKEAVEAVKLVSQVSHFPL